MGVTSLLPKKRLGLGREMPPNLKLIGRELLTTQITWMKPEKHQFRTLRMLKMILVLAEARV